MKKKQEPSSELQQSSCTRTVAGVNMTLFWAKQHYSL